MSDHSPRAELVRLIRLMVAETATVRVSASRRGRNTVLKASLPPHEIGKVIGRQGRTARALRTLLAARGEQDGSRYTLEIRER